MNDPSPPEPPSGWRQALAVYLDRHILVVLLLGYASGLPLALTLGTLSLWLADAGVSKTAIGLFALVGLPYNIKFLWAPFLDGVALPGLTRWLGRRRAWLAVIQIGLMGAIWAMASTHPSHQAGQVAIWALVIAFLSASQDVVIDAFRVEILTTRQLAAGAAVAVLGYRLGMLVSGAGALYLASWLGWSQSYRMMGVMMGLGLITTLLVTEPPQAATVQNRSKAGLLAWLHRVAARPLVEFLARPGAWIMLAFVLSYKLGDALAGLMSNLLYNELGFSLVEIANVTKVFGLAATLLGGLLGGGLTVRLGLMNSLFWFGLLQMLSNLMYLWLARAGHDLNLLMATVAIENLSGGLGTAAFVAYMSRLCHLSYTATQYALLSSLASLGRVVFSSSGGWLVDHLGWQPFFLLTVAAALPGILLLKWLARRFPLEN